jgi:hypothetical protein
MWTERLIPFFYCALTAVGGLSQITEPYDWTKNECRSGESVHLYQKISEGYVIVQEYIMLNCPPCVTAGQSISNIVDQYEASHPGRIVVYQTGDFDWITCTHMLKWADDYGFDETLLFTDGEDEINYYGEMGMPTIVILGGGSAPHVFRLQMGYPSGSDSLIRLAIDSALASAPFTAATPVVQGNNDRLELQYLQNSRIQIKSNRQIVSYEIINSSGQVVFQQRLYEPDSILNIDISFLPRGVHILKIEDSLNHHRTVKLLR